MPCSTEDDCPRKSEFEVICRSKRKHLRVHPRGARHRMPLQATVEEVITERTHDLRDKRNIQRLDPVDTKRVDVLCIVRPSHGTPRSWSQPRVALAPGDLMAKHMHGRIRLYQAKRILVRDWAERDRGLWPWI